MAKKQKKKNTFTLRRVLIGSFVVFVASIILVPVIADLPENSYMYDCIDHRNDATPLISPTQEDPDNGFCQPGFMPEANNASRVVVGAIYWIGMAGIVVTIVTLPIEILRDVIGKSKETSKKSKKLKK